MVSVFTIVSVENTYDSHVVEDIPYIGQNENFYCNWACFAMVLNHYGINATLNEVLFNHGMGYSQQYFDSEVMRLPRSGHHLSVDPIHFLYISDLYGLS